MDDRLDRYRDALVTIQAAAALLSHEQATPLNVLLSDDGDLSWSAVHTFIANVVDLGMTAQAALADLNDQPAGARDTPNSAPSAPQRYATGIPGVPDPPQGD